MLFDEFLKGTNTTENDWTLSEYARINKLYMESDTMTKAEAYSLYNEPDQLIKDLIDDKATYKAEFLKARKQQRAAGMLVYREELDNQPHIKGYCGPMYNGIDSESGRVIIRYEHH